MNELEKYENQQKTDIKQKGKLNQLDGLLDKYL